MAFNLRNRGFLKEIDFAPAELIQPSGWVAAAFSYLVVLIPAKGVR